MSERTDISQEIGEIGSFYGRAYGPDAQTKWQEQTKELPENTTLDDLRKVNIDFLQKLMCGDEIEIPIGVPPLPND